MSKYFLSLCLSILTSAAALAADLADALQSGTLWTLPQTELVDKYLNGVMYRNVDSGTMRLKAAGALTIGELSPNEIDWIWDEKKEHPASLLIVLYNKGDDGNIDKKEFNQRVKDALAALDAVCGVKGKKKNVAAKESGVKLKAWIWEWENGAAMLEAHDTGKGKKDYEAEFIRLRMAKDAAGLERGSASDAGSRRELLANVKRTEEGDVWIDNIPMIDQGEKGYCLPATVARIFSYYGMDGVDMHAMASMCDTVAGGGTTILMIVMMFAIMYFFMIRPENKKKKEAEQMRNALKVGDNITTIGGVIGDIVSVKDDSIVIETSADKVRVEFTKWAVSTNNTAMKAAAKAKEAAIAARKAEKKAKK